MSLTKIIATLGTATEKTNQITSLIDAGVDVFRFNLKHNTTNWHDQLIQKTKEASKISGRPISILLDFPDPDKKTSLPSFLEKNLSLASRHEADFLALSFVRKKSDIEVLRDKIKKIVLNAKILAKIETMQALGNFKEILDVSDGIMIARGDLGTEIPFEQVPYYQKKIIKLCIEKGKPVITATHMLESMINNPLPTRAEVSDVANAVLDYTDAVMLSAETAIGKYPLKSVSIMEKICRFWEEKRPAVNGFNFELTHQTAAVCYSAYQLWKSPFCQKENVKAFVVVTETGMTARMISRLRPNLPIIAFSGNRKIQNQLCLLYGVTPLVFEEEKGSLYKKRSFSDIEKIIIQTKRTGRIKRGDKVIIIYAEDWGIPGKTSIVRIQEVP